MMSHEVLKKYEADSERDAHIGRHMNLFASGFYEPPLALSLPVAMERIKLETSTKLEVLKKGHSQCRFESTWSQKVNKGLENQVPSCRWLQKYVTETLNEKNDTGQARMLMISYWVFNLCRYTKYSILIAQATMSSAPNNSGKFLAQKDC